MANPDEYLYWDSAHGTTAVNVLIADTAYIAVPEPSTMALLLGGAVATLYFVRKRHRNP